MKKILVTGAAGTVGLQVIRFLLSEGKYEITGLDLKDRYTFRRLKPFRKRINIVYGDVNDSMLVDSLVKDFDVVIHLAGVLPPFANANESLCKVVDYVGTMNICNAIKSYNKSCYLLYASSTSVYGKQKDTKNITIKSDKNIDELDFYSKYKIMCEDYIVNNVKNYTIFRLANILASPRKEPLIYNVCSKNIEFITPEDAGYAFVNAIDKKDEINKKVYNLAGGKYYRESFKNFIINILKKHGLSIRFLSTWFFAEKNYYGGYYSDGDEIEEILNFRSKKIDVYYSSLDKYKVWRIVPRILAWPFIWLIKKKK